jgi:hypothetical protein
VIKVVQEDLELPDPQNEGTTIIRNIGIYWPKDSAPYPVKSSLQQNRWENLKSGGGGMVSTGRNMGKEATINRQKATPNRAKYVHFAGHMCVIFRMFP